MPSVQRAHEAWQHDEVVVLTVSIDGGGAPAVASFITKHGYTFPALVDSQMTVARTFGVRAVPTTYIVNRQGMIVAGGFGPIDFDHPVFRNYINTLAAQPHG